MSKRTIVKGPIGYVHVKYKGNAYHFFGEKHNKVADCEGVSFIDYFNDLSLKNEPQATHLFLETMFVPDPSPLEYMQLIKYNQYMSRSIKKHSTYGNGEILDIAAWFWEQKKNNSNLFHPIDVRRKTNNYKGVLSITLENLEVMDEYVLYEAKAKLDNLLEFFLYGVGNFPNEVYLKDEIAKVRETCFLQQEVDAFVAEEWKRYKGFYTENIDILFHFASFMQDVYTLYAIFQTNHKNVVCYTGIAHVNTFIRFFKYIKQPYNVELNILGCVDTTLLKY